MKNFSPPSPLCVCVNEKCLKVQVNYRNNPFIQIKITGKKENLDVAYTQLLRLSLNISWKQHILNKELYENLPKIMDKQSVNGKFRLVDIAGEVNKRLCIGLYYI